MKMLSLLFLFVFGIVNAENYAILYGSVEQYTNTELPSSLCRFYDYLIAIGFNKDNIVYMLDTTDYSMDYNKYYTSWYSEENFYVRDDLYQGSCSTIDFEGEYVSPKFLLHYLIGDEKMIKSASGKSNVRMLHTTSEDNIVVYFTDSHGRGSQFYPDRILTPDLTKKAMLIMKKHKLFKTFLWLAEATYADYSFHKIDKMSNVLALTLKEPKDSGVFTYINTDEETKKRDYIESIWDNNWPSILPLACGQDLRYLYQLALSAILQMPDKLLAPGIWGDHDMLQHSLDEFIPPKEKCHEFYIYRKGNIKEDEDIQSVLSKSFEKNFNITLPMESTRRAFQNYSRFMESIVREVFLTQVEESDGLTLNSEGCQSFLHYSMQQSCHYFMPMADPLLNWFKKLCDNRKKDGMIIIDFKNYCSKNVPSDNMW